MIRACIFDFDGILADTEELHYLSYQPALESRGMEFSYEEYNAHYMAFDAIGCFKQRAADCGIELSEETLREWAELKNRTYDDLITSRDIAPLPGAIDAVNLAASKGPVAVCTGAVLSDVESLLIAFKLRPLLSALVTADDVSISKPDPESYLLAASRLGVPAAECLAIEDTPGGLQSARGAGCKTLGVTTTHTAEDLAPYADRVIDSLIRFRI
jgi:beta-phosphoglucomutase